MAATGTWFLVARERCAPLRGDSVAREVARALLLFICFVSGRLVLPPLQICQRLKPRLRAPAGPCPGVRSRKTIRPLVRS